MPDQIATPTELPEMLPDFLAAVRSLHTGQLSVMDRNDLPHYQKFIDGIVAAYRPANPLEHQLAYSIAADYWRVNRTRNVEDGIFALCHPNPTGEFGGKSVERQIAESQSSAFLFKQADFKFLSTYEMRLQRTINRNKAELQQLQRERRKLEPDTPPDHDGFAFSESPAEATTQPPPAKVRTAGGDRTTLNGFAFSTSGQTSPSRARKEADRPADPPLPKP